MNLVICGHFEPFALEISNPEETLVSSIIERIATTLHVPSVEISLYFNDQLLQPASPLSPQCGTQLRSGAALLVVVTPLIITIQRYDTDASFNVEISRLKAPPQWETDELFEFCLYKAGMPRRKNGKYVFTVQGIVLKEGKTISDYTFLNSNFTISITFLKALVYKDNITSVFQPKSSSDTHSVLIPTSCTGNKLLNSEQTKVTDNSYSYDTKKSNRLGQFQLGSPSRKQSKWYGQWKLTIQAIDGTKKKIELRNNCLTPVYELRREVSSYGKIRLIIGETVLKDFDEEGHIMLLCSYPQLHDGATLYQINLPDAITIKCQYRIGHPSVACNSDFLHRALERELDEDCTIKRPEFICIENPKNFTIERVFKAMENFGGIQSFQTNDGETRYTSQLRNSSKVTPVVSAIKCVVLD